MLLRLLLCPGISMFLVICSCFLSNCSAKKPASGHIERTVYGESSINSVKCFSGNCAVEASDSVIGVNISIPLKNCENFFIKEFKEQKDSKSIKLIIQTNQFTNNCTKTQIRNARHIGQRSKTQNHLIITFRGKNVQLAIPNDYKIKGIAE